MTERPPDLPPNYPVQYETQVLLRDGSTIHFRPIRHDDANLWRRFYDRLSDETVYLRLFGPKKRMSDEEVFFFTDVDYASRMAIIATHDSGEGESMIGVARFDLIPGTRRAEVAVVVEDAYQGRGVGTAMLDHLIAIARARRIDAFEADILARNERMVNVFESLGFDVDRSYPESDLVHVSFALADTDRARQAAENRERIAAIASMKALFEPAGVAVVGASRRENSVGGAVLRNLIRFGFRGTVYPVNPNAESVSGIHAYKTVMDVPGKIDLALVVVPAAVVPDVLRDCARRRVKAVCVISAGFAEAGEEGAALQRRVLDICRGAGMRLLGPNCLGVLNTDPAVRMNGTFAPVDPPTGGVAMSSQSGALGIAILDYARDLNLGISKFASIGNRVDVSPIDLLQYWESDGLTSVITMYLESFGNARKFARIARRVSLTKPIIAVKSGRTPAGARAAASHSASLAGSDLAADALFRQAGIIRTETMMELFDVASALAHQPIPRGDRVAILTNAGGPGILCADACSRLGLDVAPAPDETVRALAEFLPPHAALGNPIDMSASAPPEHYERAMRVLARDPRCDAVIVIYIPVMVTEPEAIAAAIVKGAEGIEIPILSCFMSSRGIPKAFLEAGHRIPSYYFPEDAAHALATAVEYGRYRRRPAGQVPEFKDFDSEMIRYVVDVAMRDGPGWMKPADASRLLSGAGLRSAKSAVASTAEEAIRAASKLDAPYAVKLDSKIILHKTDVQGVHLNVPDLKGVVDAFNAIRESALGASSEEGAFRGVVVQEMASAGVEVAVGLAQHQIFGPLIMLGTGGVMLELFKDVDFRIHPLTDVDAAEMIDSLRLRELLAGYRGKPPADRRSLEEALLRVSALIEEAPEISELDLNPVIVHDEGGGATIVDSRIRLAPPPTPEVAPLTSI